jgi:hypothetical protein
MVNHNIPPAKRTGRARIKKEARHEWNQFTMVRAIIGVKKKLAGPPIKCRPNAFPLFPGGKTCERKDVVGAW